MAFSLFPLRLQRRQVDTTGSSSADECWATGPPIIRSCPIRFYEQRRRLYGLEEALGRLKSRTTLSTQKTRPVRQHLPLHLTKIEKACYKTLVVIDIC